MFWRFFSVLLVLLLIGFAVLDGMKEQFYKFDPNVLHSVAKESLAKNLTGNALFKEIARRLEERYPGNFFSHSPFLHF